VSKLYRSLVKHSSIYAVGQILTRVVSIAMLPIYTHNLTRQDYGCIAMLDLLAAVFGILLGVAMAESVARFHFEAKTDRDRDRVWWTGLAFVIAVSTAVLFPVWLARDSFAGLLFGDEIAVADSRKYLSLCLPTVWFTIVTMLTDTYMRVRKWSKVYVGVSFMHLIISVSLICYLLIVKNLGVQGVLIGNLVANGFHAITLLLVLVLSRGRPAVSLVVLRKLWKFGAPLIITSILSTVMHQADRYFLREYLSMEDVGVYNLAYLMGQGINTLVLLPFLSIWNVAVYELAGQPDAKRVYARVFEYFVYGLLLVMLGVSLFARPLLLVLAKPEFMTAVTIVPIICLAYIPFSMSNFFHIPALLHKQTHRLIAAAVVGAVVNITANMVMIPHLGVEGAAWASVITFLSYATVGWWICRRIDPIDFPILKVCVALLCGAGVYALHAVLEFNDVNPWIVYGISSILWCATAITLGWPLRGELTRILGRRKRRRSDTPEMDEDTTTKKESQGVAS
jgi:O-antigen/teichoic acid export membrane protein